MSDQQHHGDMHGRIADLARSLHGSVEDVDQIVRRIVEYAVQEVPGAEYAGITLTTSNIRVQTRAATHRYPAMLDEIQQRHLQGPCLTAAWQEHTVRINDLAHDERWPLYARDAVQETPIKSVLSFRLFTLDETIGALNVFSNRPETFDEEAVEIGYALATHAALAWDTLRREGQFRSALASRDMIGQAKGIVMARFNIDAVRAFELLKRVSQESNVKLADIAARLTTLDSFDDIGE